MRGVGSDTIEMIPTMLTIRECSDRTGVSYDAIRKMCLQRKIVFIKVGSKYLVNFGKFVTYLNTGDQKEGGIDND